MVQPFRKANALEFEKKELRDTLTQAACCGLFNGKLANQIAKLLAIEVKN